MARPHEITGPIDPQAFVKAVQAAVGEKGGWGSSWAVKRGLTRAMVSNWALRGRVPGYWRLALKNVVKVQDGA